MLGLDDFLVLVPTKELAAEGAAQLVDLLLDLGLTVNFRESQLTPVQQIGYLGLLINLQDGMIQIPDGKVRGVCTAIDRLLAAVNPSTRRVGWWWGNSVP